MIYRIGITCSENVKGLLVNIAATFLSIPLLFLIYEKAHAFSNRRLNRELFDYVKMQVDREVLSVVNQLMKFVQSYHEQQHVTMDRINMFLKRSKSEITGLLGTKAFLGFQVFKRWKVTELSLKEILENPLILHRLENHQTIAIVTLLKCILHLEDIHRYNEDLFMPTGQNDNQFITEAGAKINDRNSEYPDRFLLLQILGENKFQVVDFGDFAPNHNSDLLKLYKLNPEQTDMLATSIVDVIDSVNTWLKSTGNQLLIDTRTFRVSMRHGN
jgi:hypothetical protein